MFLRNGKMIPIAGVIVIEGRTFQPSDLKNAALQAELGITEVPDPPAPDGRFFETSRRDDGQWNATPRPVDGIRTGLKGILASEAGRRIATRYPLHKQLNIIRAGGDPLTAMSAWIDGQRAYCNAQEAAIDALDFAGCAAWTMPTGWPA